MFTAQTLTFAVAVLAGFVSAAPVTTTMTCPANAANPGADATSFCQSYINRSPATSTVYQTVTSTPNAPASNQKTNTITTTSIVSSYWTIGQGKTYTSTKTNPAVTITMTNTITAKATITSVKTVYSSTATSFVATDAFVLEKRDNKVLTTPTFIPATASAAQVSSLCNCVIAKTVIVTSRSVVTATPSPVNPGTVQTTTTVYATRISVVGIPVTATVTYVPTTTTTRSVTVTAGTTTVTSTKVVPSSTTTVVGVPCGIYLYLKSEFQMSATLATSSTASCQAFCKSTSGCKTFGIFEQKCFLFTQEIVALENGSAGPFMASDARCPSS